MSIPVPSEHVARIRDDIRRLVRRAGAHEEQLEGLVRATEAEIREAEAALSQALTGVLANTGEWQPACLARLRRCRENADAAMRACVSAREQRVAASRLSSRLGHESVEQAPLSRCAAAVLVVDDVEDLREMAAYVLRDAGFVVRTAVNGAEALLAAYEMLPAVIVMDVMMPVLDGIEATRLIKATEATRHAKVIAHTANTSLPARLVEQLFVAILQKPSTPDVVLTAVQSVASL